MEFVVQPEEKHEDFELFRRWTTVLLGLDISYMCVEAIPERKLSNRVYVSAIIAQQRDLSYNLRVIF